MLDELQGRALLQGAWGSKPADMDAVTEAILRGAQLSQALGADLGVARTQRLG